MKKTLHASAALKAGAKLLICINPLVPYDAARAGAQPVHLAKRASSPYCRRRSAP